MADSDSDGEEVITAQKVLETLENAWYNEKFAPEILPHQSDMVDLMLDQIAHIEENVKKLEKTDIRMVIHRMELERIRYVIASYLRCRLEKIETFCSSILRAEERRPDDKKRLSETEMVFCREYHESVENHLKQLAIRHIPANLVDDKNLTVVEPNLGSHIFFKANTSIPAVVIDGPRDEEVNIKPGSQHLLPYKYVADLLIAGKVQLY